jgi:hypothetical protein
MLVAYVWMENTRNSPDALSWQIPAHTPYTPIPNGAPCLVVIVSLVRYRNARASGVTFKRL